MSKKLYVGNLSYDVTSTSLRELFSPFGTVTSADVIMDNATGQSKGFGFVEMGAGDDADAAIAALDGKDHGGRSMKVNEAKPRAATGGGGSGRPRSSAGSRRW